MRGQIRIGAMALILPIYPNDRWGNVIVKIIEGPVNLHSDHYPEIKPKYHHVPWWRVQAEDGIARPIRDSVKLTPIAWIAEPCLMPLDPPDDIKKERFEGRDEELEVMKKLKRAREALFPSRLR